MTETHGVGAVISAYDYDELVNNWLCLLNGQAQNEECSSKILDASVKMQLGRGKVNALAVFSLYIRGLVFCLASKDLRTLEDRAWRRSLEAPETSTGNFQ